ncbi:MAG: FHA domain-containing protein [Coriobacteriia bacterium]|jgi:pSer/pThr/pTyr-binding forkhead associated (FHA) protein|nr:FHA domain-containing protein [Coriobacteriia bacterium]
MKLEGTTESFAPVGAGEESTPRAPVLEAHGPALVVLKGPEVGERFFLDRPELTVGRDTEAGIFLNDVTVSRSHAVLHFSGGKVTVSDVGSLNGTFVNGERVDEAVLHDGDLLQIGKFQMVFMNRGGS